MIPVSIILFRNWKWQRVFCRRTGLLPTTEGYAGAALATRAKVLLYAASPLYNGNTEMSGLRDKQTNVPLISQVEDNKKWARAAAAAKEVIDMNYYRLYTEPADETTLPLGVGVPTEDFPNGAGNIDPYLSYRNCFNGEVPGSQNLELVLPGRRVPWMDVSMNWCVI